MAFVLIVDDEVGIAQLLEEVLKDEGHRTVLATNGKQALERVAAERPDLIITDFMMPVMDGATLVRELAAQPENESIPVIIMSSVPETTIRERCPKFALLIRKPFSIFDVVDRVSEILNGS